MEFVAKFMIGLRVNAGSPPPWAQRFTIQYTPTVIILDKEGQEHHRIVGFLPPEEFVPSLMLGIAKVHAYEKRLAPAKAMLDWLLLSYPQSRSAGEAKQLLVSLKAS